MILHCARCQNATIPLKINGVQSYACPQCGAVYARRKDSTYSFAADLQGAQGIKELLVQADHADTFFSVQEATPA